MDTINYSVIIRTTGKAGEKYAALLHSIEELQPKPKDVIVVLPEGYELPPERLGWEHFYFCKKGMVVQRLYGIQICQTPYALIVDDDIAFSSDFVQQLYQPVRTGEYGLSAGPLLDFFPPKGIQTFFWALGAAAIPACSKKARYTTMLPTTGYIYNRNIDLTQTTIYDAQSAAWTCFFADIKKLRSIHMEDELWLDRLGYSAHDDTAMFYKAWLRGIKTAIVSTAAYRHLDGKTSTRGRPVEVKRAMGYTRAVLWYRFFNQQARGLKRVWMWTCFIYRTVFQVGCDFLRFCAGKRHFAEVKAYVEGTRIGLSWVKTDEYQAIPDLI